MSSSPAAPAATQPLLAKALELLLDKGFGPHKVAFSLWLVPGILISIFALRGVFTFSTAYLNNWVLSRVLNDLRRMAFSRVLRLPVARFHEESTGKIINTVIGDVRQVVDFAQRLVREKGRIDETTLKAMETRLGTKALVEMVATVGYYGMIGTVLNAFAQEPAPTHDPLPL